MTESLGDGNQARTFLGTFKGQKAVIKAVPHPGVPGLAEFERWMIQREARALKALMKVSGVPDFLGLPDEDSIAIEYRPGVVLRNVNPAQVSERFFERLEQIVQAIHSRGIVHSDLKRKENVMMDEDGQPIVIDFGTHLMKKDDFRPIYNFLFDQFRQMDLNAVSKLKEEFCEGSMTQRDYRRLDNPTILEKADRFRRNFIWDW